jgi:hypothetical protein
MHLAMFLGIMRRTKQGKVENLFDLASEQLKALS